MDKKKQLDTKKELYLTLSLMNYELYQVHVQLGRHQEADVYKQRAWKHLKAFEAVRKGSKVIV